MKLYLNNIQNILQKKYNFYIIFGNEYVLIKEICNHIKNIKFLKKYNEYIIFNIESDTDLYLLKKSISSNSLFNKNTFIEIKFLSTKINYKLINDILKNIINNKKISILIIFQKVCNTIKKSKWFQKLNKLSIIIHLPTINYKNLFLWIDNKLIKNKYNFESKNEKNKIINLILKSADNNILSVYQEIKKLKLIFPLKILSFKKINHYLYKTKKYNIYSLNKIIFSENIKNILYTLYKIKKHKIHPLLILWVITKEIRILLLIKYKIKKKSFSKILYENNISNKYIKFKKHILNNIKKKKLKKSLIIASKLDSFIKNESNKYIKNNEKYPFSDIWLELFNLIILAFNKNNFKFLFKKNH